MLLALEKRAEALVLAGLAEPMVLVVLAVLAEPVVVLLLAVQVMALALAGWASRKA